MDLFILSSWVWGLPVLGSSSSSEHLLPTSGILHPSPIKRPLLQEGIIRLALGALVYAPWVSLAFIERKQGLDLEVKEKKNKDPLTLNVSL